MLLKIIYGDIFEEFIIMHTTKKYRVIEPKIIKLPNECIMFYYSGKLYLGCIYDFPINEDKTLKTDIESFDDLIDTKTYSIKIKDSIINNTSMHMLVDTFKFYNTFHMTSKALFGGSIVKCEINITQGEIKYRFVFSLISKVTTSKNVCYTLRIQRITMGVMESQFDYEIFELKEFEYYNIYDDIISRFPILESCKVMYKFVLS